MTWRVVECKECNGAIDYGMYFSDYMDDDTDICVEATCGDCIRKLRKLEQKMLEEGAGINI